MVNCLTFMALTSIALVILGVLFNFGILKPVRITAFEQNRKWLWAIVAGLMLLILGLWIGSDYDSKWGTLLIVWFLIFGLKFGIDYLQRNNYL